MPQNFGKLSSVPWVKKAEVGYGNYFLWRVVQRSQKTSNNLGLLYKSEETASFFSRRSNVGTNPDLAFASFGQENRLRCSRKVPVVTTSALPQNATKTQRFLPAATRWSVGTFARLIGSAFGFSQVNPPRDCHLRTHQILRGHTWIFARAYYLRLNNVSHVAVGVAGKLFR